MRKTTYTLSTLLLRVACEDAAQEAAKVEIEKQFAAQGLSVVVHDVWVNIELVDSAEIRLPQGIEVEWTDG